MPACIQAPSSFSGETVPASSAVGVVNGGRGDASGPLPTLLVFHSGGMMFGDRFSGLDEPLTWVERYGLRVITVEYRLAPEHPDPVPFEDCYRALELPDAR